MLKFESKKVVEITGVKRTRLQSWIERGWLAPSVQVAEGPGTRNIYNTNDLYSIAIFRKVSEEMHLPRKMVGEMLSSGVVGDHSEEQLKQVQYMLYIRDGENFDAALVPGPEIDIKYIIEQLGWENFDSMYLLNFAKIKNEIDQKIKTLN